MAIVDVELFVPRLANIDIASEAIKIEAEFREEFKEQADEMLELFDMTKLVTNLFKGKCPHLLWPDDSGGLRSRQENYIEELIRGEISVAAFHHILCMSCTIQIWIKSNRLKQFTVKLQQMLKNEQLKIGEIGESNHPFVRLGFTLMSCLSNPLMMRFIIRFATKQPSFLFELFAVLQDYYCRWSDYAVSLNTDIPIFDRIYVQINGILASFIYLLNGKILKYFLFEADSEEIHKLIFALMQPNEVICCMKYVISEMWWHKMFRNKDFIIKILHDDFNLMVELCEVDNKTRFNLSRRNRSCARHTRSLCYRNLKELLTFSHQSPMDKISIFCPRPEKDQDTSEVDSNEICAAELIYLAPYMNYHRLYSMCGNEECQIGYFEHKYGKSCAGGETLGSTCRKVAVNDVMQKCDGTDQGFMLVLDEIFNMQQLTWNLPKKANWYLCKACRMVRYCSRRCQKIDWNRHNHKQLCKMAKLM